MTTTQSSRRATGALVAHQPDDLRTTGTVQYCACGEQLPPGRDALAVHQVQQLLVLELLRPDPTGPLSLRALQDLTAGEVVFDVDDTPWMCCGPLHGATVWVSYCEGRPDELATDDLYVDRYPLSMNRGNGPRSCRVCGCTEDNACATATQRMFAPDHDPSEDDYVTCFWVRDPEGGNLCSACLSAPSSSAVSS